MSSTRVRLRAADPWWRVQLRRRDLSVTNRVRDCPIVINRLPT